MAFTLLYVGCNLISVGRAVYTVMFPPLKVSRTTDTVLYSKNLRIIFQVSKNKKKKYFYLDIPLKVSFKKEYSITY